MSAEERALLAAIIADPDDDTVRLVYADWLDEHDRPERAEFIRVQIELATTRREVAAILPSLSDREKILYDRFGSRWSTPFSSTPCCADFERGFISRAWSSASEAPDVLLRLSTVSPLRQVHFLSPWTSGELYTETTHEDDDGYSIPLLDVQRVAYGASEPLAGIRALTVICADSHTPDRAIELIARRDQPLDERLAFSFSRCLLGESGARCLAESAVFEPLAEIAIDIDVVNFSLPILGTLRDRFKERFIVHSR
ncbi:MAG: hypothetical protein JWO38_5851 [Gemmataceae bacterium]|nr:hypothetical protein [Gemmataceae bacterium]